MPYEKRLAEFLSRYSQELDKSKMIGFEDWYFKGGHYTSSYCFHPRDLAVYFKSGERKPCLMRGSLLAMRDKSERSSTKYYLPYSIFKRYIRRIKFTCYSGHEWREFISYARAFRRDQKEGRGHMILTRIKDKWGGHNNQYLERHINNMMRGESDSGAYCLVNGKEIYMDKEQYDAIMSMNQFAEKLGKIDDRRGTEEAA
jgi:hypothetical protein